MKIKFTIQFILMLIPSSYSYDNIKRIRGLVTSFEKISPNDKGYNLLKSSNQTKLVDDQLVNDIIAYYSTMMSALPELNQAVVEVSKTKYSRV